LFTRILSRPGWISAGLVALAAPLALAEEAAEHAAEQPNIFSGTIGNAIWTLVIFGLVIVVLGKYAWGPILNLLNERERKIRESLEMAKREREEAERVLEKYTQQIEQARAEASKIVDAGRKNGEEVARRIQEQAREEAGQMVERARQEIKLATEAAKKEVFDVAAELAVEVAGRIIKKELSPADHKGLVAESIEQMKSSGGRFN